MHITLGYCKQHSWVIDDVALRPKLRDEVVLTLLTSPFITSSFSCSRSNKSPAASYLTIIVCETIFIGFINPLQTVPSAIYCVKSTVGFPSRSFHRWQTPLRCLARKQLCACQAKMEYIINYVERQKTSRHKTREKHQLILENVYSLSPLVRDGPF